MYAGGPGQEFLHPSLRTSGKSRGKGSREIIKEIPEDKVPDVSVHMEGAQQILSLNVGSRHTSELIAVRRRGQRTEKFP